MLSKAPTFERRKLFILNVMRVKVARQRGKEEWCQHKHYWYFLNLEFKTSCLPQYISQSIEPSMAQGPSTWKGETCVLVKLCTLLQNFDEGREYTHRHYQNLHAVWMFPIYLSLNESHFYSNWLALHSGYTHTCTCTDWECMRQMNHIIARGIKSTGSSTVTLDSSSMLLIVTQ